MKSETRTAVQNLDLDWNGLTLNPGVKDSLVDWLP